MAMWAFDQISRNIAPLIVENPAAQKVVAGITLVINEVDIFFAVRTFNV